MAPKIINNAIAMQFALALILVILLASNPGFAAKKAKQILRGVKMNAIDQCWRRDLNWMRNRPQLAMCSVGFAGKMSGNAGRGLIHYTVTDPSDNAVNPKPGTLRYGATMIRGKVWITFQRDMRVTLQKTLLISSFTAIDGRGFNVHIAGNACLMVFQESNIIIHGLHIHDCRPQAPSLVMNPDGKVVPLGQVDGDAIRLVSASKVWIDHNTLYQCQDGLLDVTRGTTDITISNNWFRDQDKVMLLGHDDGYVLDKNMKVTVIYNHFGPNCNQRMPRLRHGYAHVVNNMYNGWGQYAIGGSMSPRVKSEANLFIAPKSGNKEVTSRMDTIGNKQSWKFYSVRDVFENGASFIKTGFGGAKPNYNPQQSFPVVDAKFVRLLTRSAGALRCTRSTC
ncbi:probable pectate lyase 9 [Morus notabilis]|uniref:probable pectate lyase 9 n=1 Tax=Morus notabilis TaxID=981085 RepID=UPI000CED7E22|nr:probable pectate lyase 9 [Morus notabilis]